MMVGSKIALIGKVAPCACAGSLSTNVTPPSAAKNDFRLTTPVQRVSLANAGHYVVPVFVERDGYEGPIEITAVGLPTGVKLEGTTIAEGRGGTLVTFVREGVGEPALIATAPAILAAIRHATGVRVTRVPVLPHRLWQALRTEETP